MNKTDIKKEKDYNKMIEGLGILLMLVGVSMVKDFSAQIINWKTLIPLFVACGGWLIYTFSDRIGELK